MSPRELHRLIYPGLNSLVILVNSLRSLLFLTHCARYNKLVKDFFKNTASFFIALAILLGILFIPEYKFNEVINLLNFLSKGTTAYSFSNYLTQKIAVGFVLFIIIVTLSILSRKRKV